MIQSPKDIADAFQAGRVHTQRFLKNAGAVGDSHWQDWAYASGQPAYDARIGDALTLTPQVAVRNDAIWFPGIGAGQTRHLIGLRQYVTAGGVGQLSVESELYDLLAVYPLIDGDNTDPQPMDNTAALPRYADGAGRAARGIAGVILGQTRAIQGKAPEYSPMRQCPEIPSRTLANRFESNRAYQMHSPVGY